jgi:hypothetical protein
MKSTISLLLFTLISQALVAQTMLRTELKIRNVASLMSKTVDPEVVGTPYLNDEFLPGIVYITPTLYDDVLIRYNIHADQMEVEINEGIYALESKKGFQKIKIGNRSFKAERIDRGSDETFYVEVLDSGALILVSKKAVTFKEKQGPTPMKYQGSPATYTRLPDVLYYKIGNGSYQKFSNIKKMIETLPDNLEEVKAFAKSKNLAGKEAADVVELVKFYNSLHPPK